VGRVSNHYVWQGGQIENQGRQTEKNFVALCTKFYQTNVCPPWPETLPAPLSYMDYRLLLMDMTQRLTVNDDWANAGNDK